MTETRTLDDVGGTARAKYLAWVRELKLCAIRIRADEPHIRQWCFRRQAVKTLLQS
jgi:hypothetical protein